MRVLHLSTSDTGGGAARAAHRLHTGLRALGVDSTMLALRAGSGDPTVVKLHYANDVAARLRRSVKRHKIRRDFRRYRHTLPADFELFSDDRSEAGLDLLHQLPAFDVINLHWVAGLVDHRILFPRLPKNVPVVWRMADMGAFTGGCHYDGGCGKFAGTCGACPVLGSSFENDLSRQVWRRKNLALASLKDADLHVVGPSRWVAAQARASSLLGRFPASVIPNGLDVTAFAPRGKSFSRDVLGIPAGAKVVLFVAESAASRRKGFAFLAAALDKLKATPNLFLLSVGVGKPEVPNLPQLHMGRLGNDRILSMVYSAADCFVIPSVQESFGQTVIESMACGTPVVGFDTGGIPDMVRPGSTGYLAKVSDADDLAKQVGGVLNLSPNDWQTMSESCRLIAVEEYSMRVQAENYLKLYQSIIPLGLAA